MGINSGDRTTPGNALMRDKLFSELLLSGKPVKEMANVIRSFLDNKANIGLLDSELLEVLHAIPQRLEWLTDRVQSHEHGRDMSMVSNTRVRQGSKILNDNIEVIGALLPVIHPVHGEEPKPYSQPKVGGVHRRFVNPEWTKWYSSFNDAGDVSLLYAAADRTVDMLFPTPASKEGLSWSVSAGLIEDQNAGTVTYPHEIVITRSVQARV